MKHHKTRQREKIKIKADAKQQDEMGKRKQDKTIGKQQRLH
jgi:hypothetical protein